MFILILLFHPLSFQTNLIIIMIVLKKMSSSMVMKSKTSKVKLQYV